MKRFISLLLSVVLCIVSFGVISLSADTSFFGDVNNDGTVNNKDLGLLMQYLNHWDVTINITDSDVNIDGNINNKDYGLLMQYLNKWDVQLGVKQENDVNPNDYRGTSITFATTVLSSFDESGPVIEKFEKEYDIKVKEVLVGDNVYEVAGMIASGLNVDVMRCNGEFPAVLAVLQPLDAAKLDLTDPIWDKNFIDMTTIKGKPYLCNTVGNIWSEGACVIYSKSLLEKANCYTPEEYDALGKWTWDGFAEIAKVVEKLDGMGTGIRGCYYSVDDMLGSVGCRLYDYSNGTFTNGINNSMQAKAFSKMANWYKEGFVTDSITDPFNKGNVGICTGMAWSLKKNGSNQNYNWNDIGFYRMPDFEEGYDAYQTGLLRGWGIVRGADNPVGAGIFLRYYLDIGNYDVNNSFISIAAEQFFFKMANIDYSRYTPYFTYEYSTENISGFYEYEWENIATGNPNYVAHNLSWISANVDKACENINLFVNRNT